jgi:hypothetical protein
LEKVEEVPGYVGFPDPLLAFQHDDLELSTFAAFVQFDQKVEQRGAALQKGSIQKRLQ